MDFINNMQDLTLKQDQNMTNMTNTPALPPVMPVTNHEEPKEDGSVVIYNMTKQEFRLQHKKEKYRIYMSTFSYEGDDSDLDSKMDTDSNATAYLFLTYCTQKESHELLPLKKMNFLN